MRERTEKYTTNADLLPCPFCGGVARSEYIRKGQTDVFCDDPYCPVKPMVSGTNLVKAAACWNTRATTANDMHYRRKLLAEIVQELCLRGVITAKDVASVGGGK